MNSLSINHVTEFKHESRLFTHIYRVITKRDLRKPGRPLLMVAAQDLGDDSTFHHPLADISGAAANGPCLPSHH